MLKQPKLSNDPVNFLYSTINAMSINNDFITLT